MPDQDTINKIYFAPIDSIQYGDILEFCELMQEEGIDLDYKSDWPNDLEKVLCSFANTQGGITLLGVPEDGKTRVPKLPLCGVEGDRPTIRQRIISIAMDGIYPPLSPEVCIVDHPEASNKCIALIRIHPSKLVHFTDRRKRIYIRVADNSKGYDLASVTELAWLWNQRALVTEKRNQIYTSAIKHSDNLPLEWASSENTGYWTEMPMLNISVLPSFPNPATSINTDDLLKIVISLPQISSTWKEVYRQVPRVIANWRTIPGGVCTADRGIYPNLEYLEFGEFAHMHAAIGIVGRPINDKDPTSVEYLFAFVILSFMDLGLKLASHFYEKISFTWPITVQVDLETKKPLLINYASPTRRDFIMDYLSKSSPDLRVNLLNREIAPSELLDKTLLISAAHMLFWAYGLGWDETRVTGWFDSFVN